MTDLYSLTRTFGGLSLEYAEIDESVFASPVGAAYVPPERGDFRIANNPRQVQLLQECPGVVETFQTSVATIILPANDVAVATNDAGNGRMIFFINSGVGNITINDYFGNFLYAVSSGCMVIILSSAANSWDFLAVSTNVTSGTNVVVDETGNGIFNISSLNLSSNTTSASPIVLTSSSDAQQYFTGNTPDQIVQLPDGSTLGSGQIFSLQNASQVNIQVVDSNSNPITWIFPYQTVFCVFLSGNSWNYFLSPQYQQAEITTSNNIQTVGLILPIPNNSQTTIEYTVSAICTSAGSGPNSTGDAATWKRNVRVVNIGGTLTKGIEQNTYTNVDSNAASWLASSVVMGTNLELKVQGTASTLRWALSAGVNVLSF